MKKAGIAGAGLIGRLLALRLLETGWNVTIFDKDVKKGHKSCGVMAGGMLSPITEIETSEKIIFELGIHSLSLWKENIKKLHYKTHFQTLGSIVVSPKNDVPELQRFLFFIKKKVPLLTEQLKIIDSYELQKIEPELNPSLYGVFIPFEGNIDNKQLFLNLELTLKEKGIIWYESTQVNEIYSKTILADNLKYSFDIVFDCRGFGAKDSLKELRGIRGELITVYAPQVKLLHPIRIMTSRYRVYVVPRPNNIFAIGASEIESDDISNISVKSLLELLSSSYYLHKGFAEARIEEIFTNCRPTFENNLPKIYLEDKLIRINGLYRHGYLISPALVEDVMLIINHKEPTYTSLVIK